MSQIEMKELKDWLNDPAALKFKKILLNSRAKLLNNISQGYLKSDGSFKKDSILSNLGECLAMKDISNFFGNKDEAVLENLLKVFYGGENE
jgi:hypothetical protein